MTSENLNELEVYQDMVKNLRSARSHARKTISSINSLERKWPDEGVDIPAKHRKLMEEVIDRTNSMETELVLRVADLKRA